MTNATTGKRRLLVVAVLACLCAAAIALPAYGFYYVHDEGVSEEAEGRGVIEVFCVVDETATGGTTTSSLIFLPEGSVAADCLDEGIKSSENQNGLDAIHDYSYESLGDYLSDKTYTVSVYEAASQQPGTQTTYDTDPIGGEDTVLERYSNVVFTVSE